MSAKNKFYESNVRTNSEQNQVDIENDEIDYMVTEEASKRVYWNPPITWDWYKKARVHYDKFGGGGRPVEVEYHPHERIKKEVIRTIIDFVTSDEQQQSVAFGTMLVKTSNGERRLHSRKG